LSFKYAAEELHVTHAAVSHQIKALEADLGMQLFHRKPQGVELTDQATEFAARLGPVFGEIAAATEALKSGVLEGEIGVTMAPYFANRCVLPYLQDFHDAYPGLIVRPDMTSGILDLRGSGCLAGIRYGFGSWPGMTKIRLYEDLVSPVAAPSQLAGKTLPLSPEQIAKMVLGEEEDLTNEWEIWFRAAKFTGPIPSIVNYSNRARVADMAIAGGGAGLLDRHLIAADIQEGRLVKLHPLAIPSAKSMYIVFPESEHPDQRVLAFATWIKGRFEADKGLPKRFR
jgi:LysR family glycine cleavage system transcriptional activator